MRCYKKAMHRTAIIGALAMVSLAMGLVTEASAGCPNLPGFNAGAAQPMSWQGKGEFGPGSPLLVADRDNSDDGIVGFWRVMYVSKGTPGVPDGTVFDEGFQQWHSDGTEFHWDTVTPPAGSNFCLGIWKKTGRSHYALNHFFLAVDPTTNSLQARGQSVKKSTWTVAAMNISGPLRSMAMIPQGSFFSTRRARCTRPVSP